MTLPNGRPFTLLPSYYVHPTTGCPVPGPSYDQSGTLASVISLRQDFRVCLVNYPPAILLEC